MRPVTTAPQRCKLHLSRLIHGVESNVPAEDDNFTSENLKICMALSGTERCFLIILLPLLYNMHLGVFYEAQNTLKNLTNSLVSLSEQLAILKSKMIQTHMMQRCPLL